MEIDIIGSIKLQKQFWDLMVNGTKTLEFRKLSKGLEEGDYQVESVERTKTCGECDECQFNYIPAGLEAKEFLKCSFAGKPKKIFGTIHLKPFAVNPVIKQFEYHAEFSWGPERQWKTGILNLKDPSIPDEFGNGNNYLDFDNMVENIEIIPVDEGTMKFVEDNYVGKCSYIAYEISNVLETAKDVWEKYKKDKYGTK